MIPVNTGVEPGIVCTYYTISTYMILDETAKNPSQIAESKGNKLMIFVISLGKGHNTPFIPSKSFLSILQ